MFSGLRGRKIDDDTWDDLEEAMLLADVGLATTQRILDAVRARAKADDVVDADGLVALVRDEVVAILDASASRELAHRRGRAQRVDVRGRQRRRQDHDDRQARGAAGAARAGAVVLAAADTFRAAAADQLGLWAERTGGELVRGQDGADPGSVVFDAMAAASSRGADLVLVDTAGRLHTKSNLMEELKKLRRIVDRTEGACKEVLLVIDASTGQNGLVQAKQFADAVDVTGIVLTKLDGTAKGGIVLAIQSELGLPVKAVGVGESVEDLVEFDPQEFAAALFDAERPSRPRTTLFDALSDRLEGIFTGVRNRGRLSERDIDEVTREIRRALLEADVNVQVARAFIDRVKEQRARRRPLEEPLAGPAVREDRARRAREDARRHDRQAHDEPEAADGRDARRPAGFR